MKTILIVEDNKTIREDISDIFKIENYRVLEADNGMEGYSLAIKEIPDIIISDIMMPKLDGYEMVKKLQENKITDNIPVIFLTALSTENDIRKGMNLGADDYLTKPIKPDILLKAADSKLKKHERLENKLKSLKLDLTNVLHHELNTPLNGVIGFSDFLKDRVFDMSKENIKEVVDNIHFSGERLHFLVIKYLLFADLNMISADPDEIKKLRQSSYIETFEIINKTISRSIPNERLNDTVKEIDKIKLKISDKHFTSLIQEMLENALKFSEQGDKITIYSNAIDDRYLLSVKNKGKGMKTDDIKMINDFKQFGKEEDAQQGSGLGLSIIKLISEIYDADFKIESSRNNYFNISIEFTSGFEL